MTEATHSVPQTVVGYFESPEYQMLRSVLPAALALGRVDHRHLSYLDSHQSPETVLMVLTTLCYNLTFYYAFLNRTAESRYFADRAESILEARYEEVKRAYVFYLIDYLLDRLPGLPRITMLSPALQFLLSPLGSLYVTRMRLSLARI